MESLLVTSGKTDQGKWFESLWEDEELADVTLVCRDGSQLKSHKAVLALSSPLLRTILTRSKRPDPVLLMLTTDALVLEKLLRLVYFGQVSLPSDQLESLLSAADALQLSLLSNQQVTKAKVGIQQERQITSKAGEAEQDLKFEVKPFGKETKTKLTPQLVALHPDTSLEKKIRFDLDRSTRISSVHPDEQVNTTASCSECGKEFEAFNHLWVHIQSVHHMRYQCKNCGKRYQSASVLNQHVESAHNGIHLVCQDCGKKFTLKATLNKHIRNKHST